MEHFGCSHITGLIAGVLALCSCTQKAADSFTLSGTIADLPDSTKVVLVNKEAPDSLSILGDTIIGPGETFTFTGKLDSPKMCSLSFKKFNDYFGKYSNVASFTLMLENGETTVVLNESFDSLRNSYQPELLVDVKGGEAQRQYMEYYNAISESELTARKARYKEAEKWFETKDDPDTMKIYKAITEQTKNAYEAAELDFIKAHPTYAISAYRVWDKLADVYKYTPDQLQEWAEIVSVCPDTARVSRVNRRLEFSKEHALGVPVKNFRMLDVKGDTVDFVNQIVPGKYNFVDVWASWCGPCRAAIPHVKELQQTYGDRLNIISVSGDTDNSAWRKAMDEEKMTWPQFYLGEELLNSAAQTYMLSSIPRLLVFDDNGILVLSTNMPGDVSEYLQQNIK